MTTTTLLWDDRDLHIVTAHPHIKDNDRRDFEDNYFQSKTINYVPMGMRLLDLLVEAKLFKSKNDARRTWKRGFDLAHGWNRFERIGKLKKNLYILNLTDDFVCLDDMEESTA